MPIFKRRKKFGEIALKKGFITGRQLEQALAEQEQYKAKGWVQKRIGAILLEKGFIEMGEIAETLEEQKKGTIRTWIGAFFSLKTGI